MEQEQIKNKVNQLINEGYTIDIGGSINEGWSLFQKNLGGFVGYTALYVVIMVTAGIIPIAGSFASILIGAPLAVGFYLVANHLRKNTEFEFGEFFNGFNFFGALVLASLISSIFIGLGFILLIIPGVYLAVAYSFTYQFIVFGNMEFWDAMEASRKMVSKNWFPVFGLLIVLGLINFLGLIMLGIGILFTIPLTYCVLYVVFAKLFKEDGEVTVINN